MMRKVQGYLGLTCLIAFPFSIAISSVLSFRRTVVPKKALQCGSEFDLKFLSIVRPDLSTVYAPEGQEVCPLGLCCSRYG
jgi:hypothetical protein